MTREEIREGTEAALKHFASLVRSNPKKLDAELAKNMRKEYLAYLHSQGVVIKVDRELPESKVTASHQSVSWKAGQHSMLKAGYVAVEPLIKEESNVSP